MTCALIPPEIIEVFFAKSNIISPLQKKKSGELFSHMQEPDQNDQLSALSDQRSAMSDQLHQSWHIGSAVAEALRRGQTSWKPICRRPCR